MSTTMTQPSAASTQQEKKKMTFGEWLSWYFAQLFKHK